MTIKKHILNPSRINCAEGTDSHLREARRIFRYAEREYKRAKERRNELKAIQAVEKGYLCLLKTVDALFVRSGLKEEKLPRVERGRLHFLRRYGDKELRIIYSAIRHDFHIDAFHEGIINYKILDERFEDLKDLVKRVAGL